MTLNRIIKTGIAPAMPLLPVGMDSQQARVMLLAIGLQESRFEHRYQVVQGKPGAKGPARGFWQFELGTAASRGGVWGVFLHDASNGLLKKIAVQRGVALSPTNIWQALETDDVLAAGLARLLLWTDPRPLPAVGDEAAAWQLYLRTWRPGAWDRGTERQRAELRSKWGGIMMLRARLRRLQRDDPVRQTHPGQPCAGLFFWCGLGDARLAR